MQCIITQFYRDTSLLLSNSGLRLRVLYLLVMLLARSMTSYIILYRKHWILIEYLSHAHAQFGHSRRFGYAILDQHDQNSREVILH